MAELTQLLQRMHAGEEGARNDLFAAAYPELRRLARSRLRDGGRNTVMDTTSLVHESYLRFLQAGELRAEDRRAFFAYASQVMRSVVVDTARERLAQRRGGDLLEVTMNTELVGDLASDDASVLRMSEALDALAAVDNRLGQVVEMRFFGGYSMAEIAETLQITERTVQRDWDKARLLLAASLD